jgi:hypothetical protein
MTTLLEKLIARIWNRWLLPGVPTRFESGVELAQTYTDRGARGAAIRIAHDKRAEHVVVLGRTGAGKSSLLRHLCAQDVEQDFGFLQIDLHGDATPATLRYLAAEERRRQVDLSDRVIVIEPGDPEWAVALNVLAAPSDQQRFVYIADVAHLLKQRWGLEAFGARTEELLRNALLALSENHLTLIDLPPFLTNAAFRAGCLRLVRNPEVTSFFASRYDTASDAMQATWREAVLNKVTAFTADPHFRHLLGQVRANLSLIDAVDRGAWLLVNLDKGRLGDQAPTLGALLLAKLKTALFARRSRRLFTVYADELQNLVAYDGASLETMLAESRKYGVGIVAANQFTDQYPASMRAAIMAVGTHITFQLSSVDADRFAASADGGKALAALLKNLPRRHVVVKCGAERWQHGIVPEVRVPRIDYRDLLDRSRRRWARKRTDIERDIHARHAVARPATEVLDGWD